MPRIVRDLPGLLAAADEASQAEEAGLSGAWERTFVLLGYVAARRFEASVDALVAGGYPTFRTPRGPVVFEARPQQRYAAEWAIPDVDAVLPLGLTVEHIDTGTGGRRQRLVSRTAAAAGRAVGLRLDLKNPLVDGVLTRMGGKITKIAEDTRRDVMRALDDAWRQGLSIPDAAKAVRGRMLASTARASMIARTEVIGARNGGSLAAVRTANAVLDEQGEPPLALLKEWLATSDERTRPSHADANGQQVPLDASFSVGSDSLAYPGDPSGSAEEVVNCRCTVVYVEADAAG